MVQDPKLWIQIALPLGATHVCSLCLFAVHEPRQFWICHSSMGACVVRSIADWSGLVISRFTMNALCLISQGLKGNPVCLSALPRLLSRDPTQFWTSGQWMTEKRGGSDVGMATLSLSLSLCLSLSLSHTHTSHPSFTFPPPPSLLMKCFAFAENNSSFSFKNFLCRTRLAPHQSMVASHQVLYFSCCIFAAAGTETIALKGDHGYQLYGYKWFTSASDANMSLTLARSVDSNGQPIPVCMLIFNAADILMRIFAKLSCYIHCSCSIPLNDE